MILLDKENATSNKTDKKARVVRKYKEECKHLKENKCWFKHPKGTKDDVMKETKEKGANKGKKNTLCKFLKNCRNGNSCDFYHPVKKISKDGEEEMQKTLHFLKEQMVKQMKKVDMMSKEIKFIKNQREE